MYRIMKKLNILLAVLVLGITLVGCSAIGTGQQAALQPNQADGLMEGPGLFSGEDGSFVIYKK